MLRTPAPFPQVGSYALIEQEGRNHLARIVGRTAGAECVIALPLMPNVASGNRTVSLGELKDGTDLTERERRELEELDTALNARTRLGADRKKRAETLRSRLILAPILANLMAQLPDPTRRVSRVAA